MNQIPELDTPNPFCSFPDSDFSLFCHDTLTQLPDYPLHCFPMTQRRERIDSEDFNLPKNSKAFRELDLFQQDQPISRIDQPEECVPRKKSSSLLVTDPTLIELEVG